MVCTTRNDEVAELNVARFHPDLNPREWLISYFYPFEMRFVANECHNDTLRTRFHIFEPEVPALVGYRAGRCSCQEYMGSG
jgi:hypothetical protein